jgi:cell division protein FtsA
MEGMVELAEQIFNLPVQVGMPRGVSGLTEIVGDPSHATGVGLVLYGYRNRYQKGMRSLKGGNLFDRISDRMRRWWGDFF